MVHDYLPINREDMKKRGWEQCDFVYVSGDAYVDHPSFGTAIISRLLEAHGYKVGIIAQPDWKDKDSVTIYGEPRHPDLRTAKTGIFGVCGKYGFHGKPLFRIQKAQKRGLLYSWWGNGKKTGLCSGGILQPDPFCL